MKFSISNIAWQQADESALLPYFRGRGISGIEIAPTSIWPEWQGLDVGSARAYADFMLCEGFEIPSMQAIFYGKEFGSIFENANHDLLLEHLDFIADIAAAMNVATVIFGAPSIRQFGDLQKEQAESIALKLMQYAGNRFHSNGVKLCLEACSKNYKCDFVTSHSELISFIKLVDSPGFCLHIDSANLYESKEDLADILNFGMPIQHFHMSEPGLRNFETSCVPHIKNLDLLSKSNYEKWVSIEMLATRGLLQKTGPWHLIQGYI